MELCLQLLEEMLKQIYDSIQIYYEKIFELAIKASQLDISNVITRA